MAKKVGLISIDLQAGVAKFNADIALAKTRMKDFAASARGSAAEIQHANVSGMQASSAALRLFEGNLQNNLRAVENFLSKTLGLGPVLKAAFPVVGATAFAGLLAELGEKLVNFFQTLEQHGEKTTGMFRELNDQVRVTNDTMRVANDKLENEIAKLEHRPQNVLKLALDEATLAADKLAESLDKDLASLGKLLSETKQGFWADVVSRESGTKDIAEELSGKTGFGGFRARIAGMSPADEAKAFDEEMKKLEGWLSNARQAGWQRQFGLSGIGGQEAQGNRIETLEGVLRNLTQARQGIDLSTTGTSLTARKTSLEANKANIEEESRELKAGYDRMLADQERDGEMLASEKQGFREQELREISQYGSRYKTLMQELRVEIANLEQTAFKEYSAARKADLKDQTEYEEKLLHNQEEWAMKALQADKAMTAAEFEAKMPETQSWVDAFFKANPLSREGGAGRGGRGWGDNQFIRLSGKEALDQVEELSKKGYDTIEKQTAHINEEQETLNELIAQGGYSLGEEVKQRQKILELTIQLNKTLEGREAADAYRKTQIEELLRQGSLKSGMDAFWIEMQMQAEKPGVIFEKGMLAGFDGVSKSISDAMTGGKGNWGKMFAEVGRQMNEEAVKSLLHTGLGAIGARLGIGPKFTRDGQTRDRGKFVVPVDENGNPLTMAPGSMPSNAPDWMGSIYGGPTKNPFIWNLANAASPFASTGGVGMPRLNSMGAGGATRDSYVYYINVDARGADENTIYARVAQGVMAAHNAAVSNSVRATYEKSQRTPGGGWLTGVGGGFGGGPEVIG